MVTTNVWFHVGSGDEKVRRTGFAHLFEHLMFKSTTNLPPEGFDRLTEDAGGFNNASTWNDFTNYYETVPANHLERVLWGEADIALPPALLDGLDRFVPELEVRRVPGATRRLLKVSELVASSPPVRT